MNEERLYEALKNADAAGDTEAATTIAQEIRALRSKSTQQPKQPEPPKVKPKTDWGTDFELAWDSTKERLASGFDRQKDIYTLGTQSDQIKAEREKRRQEYAQKREQLLQGKEQGFFGELLPSLATGLVELPALPYSILGKGINKREDLEKVTDPQTARMGEGISYATDLAGVALPVSAQGGALFRAITGGGIGGVSGVADQFLTQKLLKARGYEEEAKKYEVTPKDTGKGIVAGAVMGLVAGRRPAKASTGPSLADQNEAVHASKAAEAAKAAPDAGVPPKVDLGDADILAKVKQAVVDQKAMDKTTKGPLKTGRQAREGNVAAQAFSSANTPEPAPGTVRYYHGGAPGDHNGPLWFTSDLKNAQGWANRDPSMKLWYVDIPENSPLRGGDPSFGVLPPSNIELPANIASKRQQYSHNNAPSQSEALSALKEFIMKQAEDEKAINKTTKGPLKTSMQAREGNVTEPNPRFGPEEVPKLGYEQPPIRMDGPPESRPWNIQEAAADSHAARVRAERAAEAERLKSTPTDAGLAAARAIDEQSPMGQQFGGIRAPDAGDLEATNRVQPQDMSPESMARFGNEMPPGVVNPKALEAVNRMTGANPEMSLDQASRYSSDFANSGVVNPKAVDRMRAGQQDVVPQTSPEAIQLQRAMEEANRIADGSPVSQRLPTRKMGSKKNQGGMINFGALFPKKTQNRLNRPDTDHFITDAGVSGLRTAMMRKKGPLDDFLSNRSYQEIIDEVIKNPDVDPHSTGVGRQFRAGATGHFISKKDPIMAKAYWLVHEASNARGQFAEKYIHGGPGTIVWWKDQLNKKELTEIENLITQSAKKDLEILPEIRAKLTPNQRGYLAAHEAMFNEVYDSANKTYKTIHGTDKNLERRNSYTPATFPGTYKTIVWKTIKDQNGVEKNVIDEVLSAETRHGLNKIKQKLYPNKVPNGFFEDLEPRGLNEGLNIYQNDAGMSAFISKVAEKDPDLAKALTDSMSMADFIGNSKLYGQDKHALHRKGISGSAGDQRWLTPEQNAEAAFKAKIDFAKQAIYAHELARLRHDFNKNLTNNPTVSLYRPKALKEAGLYIDNATGTKINPIGSLGNWILNGAAHSLGVSPNLVTKGAASHVKFETQIMIGTLNPMFIGQQFAQLITSHAPMMELLRGRLDGGQTDVAAAVAKGTKATSLLLTERIHPSLNLGNLVSPFDRAAWKYAQKNQLMNLTEMEHLTHGVQNRIVRGKDWVLELGPKIGELTTRPTAFMNAVHLLKDFQGTAHKYTDEEIFDIARTATQNSMIEYSQSERPMFWSQMGVAGQYFGKFKTYPSGWFDNQRVLAKEAFKGHEGKRNVSPALMSGLAALGLAGVLGLPMYDTVSDIFAYLSEKTGKRIDPRKYVLDNAPAAASHGLLSDVTGVNLQPKFDMSNVIPSEGLLKTAPPAQAMMNRLTIAAEMMKSGFAASDINDFLLTFASPGQVKQGAKSWLERNNERNSEGKRAVYKVGGDTDVYRSDEEQAKVNLYGAPLLTEAMQKERDHLVNVERQKETLKRQELIKLFVKLKRNNVPEGDPRYASIWEAYKEAGGTPDQWSTSGLERLQSSGQTSHQRLSGLPKDSIQSQQKYQSYNPPKKQP